MDGEMSCMKRPVTRRKLSLVGAAVLLAVSLAVPHALANFDTQQIGGVVTDQHYQCGARDLPEGPIQGDVPKADQDSGRAQKGYNCGLALVGHANLDFGGRPPGGNANMAWANNCAYVAGPGAVVGPPSPADGAGVAVVSVTPGGVPTHVATLRQPGSIAASETLGAVTTPEGRSILVVGQYGNQGISQGPKPMDIYDVSDPDCTKSKFLGTYMWPDNIHNLTISGNGRYVFATMPMQVLDITPLWDADPATGPVFLGNLNNDLEGPAAAPGPLADLDDNVPAPARQLSRPVLTSHEAYTSFDGTTLYMGGVTPAFEIFSIVDLTQWLQRDANNVAAGPPRVISQRSGRGHSVRTATINGAPYVLQSEESVFGGAFGCVPETANPAAGPAQPWLTNIANPSDPKLVSQFGLEINNPENCLEQLQSGANQSVHYHDVDDPKDTTFVMASMWNAGLRIFDVRDPVRPTEVAYFNPGDVDASSGTNLDQAWGHVRYVKERNQIWFATASGGFWVVRLEGPVRRHLGLGGGRRDAGYPGTLGVTYPTALPASTQAAAYSCTLAGPTAAIGSATPAVSP